MQRLLSSILLSACLLVSVHSSALVRNGGFESVLSGKQLPAAWSLATPFVGSLDGNAAEGERCFKLDAPEGSTGILIQSLKLKPGATYTLTYQVKAARPGEKYRLYVEYSTMTKRLAGALWGSSQTGTSWEKKSFTFTMPDDLKSCTLVLYQVKESSTLWFDDFKLAEGKPATDDSKNTPQGESTKQVSLKNPGFETLRNNGLPVGWSTPNAGASIDEGAPEGNKCIKLENATGTGILIQALPLSAGKTYTITYKVKAAQQGQKYQVYVEYSTLTKRLAGARWGSSQAGTAWVEKSFTFTMPDDLKSCTLVLRQIKGSVPLWFDDFRLVETEAQVGAERMAPPRKPDTLLNPGFEEQLTGWETGTPAILKIDAGNAHNSKQSLLFVDAGTITQDGIVVALDTRYRLTAHVMCEEFNHPYRFFVGWRPLQNGSIEHGGISQRFGLERQDGFTAWQKKSIEFRTPVKPFKCMYITLENLAPGKVWFDNLVLEKVAEQPEPPVVISLDSPSYRNTIYESSPVSAISGKLTVNAKVSYPANVTFELAMKGQKPLTWQQSIESDGRFTLPLSESLDNGEHVLTTRLKYGNSAIAGNLPIFKVAKAEYEVLPDENNMLCLNKQPFFPVGLYEPDFTEDDFRKYQHLGFNTILYHSTNGPSMKLVMDKAHAYGLKVIGGCFQGDREITQHPAFLGYHNSDEPAWMGSDCGKIVREYQAQAVFDPYHPVWMNHAPRNDIKTLARYNAGCDISGVDIYPVTSSPKGSGHSDLKDRTISCIGKYAVKMRESVSNRKPIFMVLQGFAWEHLRNASASNARYPSYVESRFMAWDSIIHGANGILFYATNRMKPDHPLWLDLGKVNHEIRALSEIITAPAGAACRVSDPAIAVATRRHGKNQVVFLANTSNTQRKASITSDAFTGKCLELYKNSPIRKNGNAYELEFAPYEVKIISTQPIRIDFDPARNYTFPTQAAKNATQDIPFDNLGNGVMGHPWKGGWIWSSGRPFAPKAFLRREIQLDDVPKSAHIAITADWKYRLLVNGHTAGEGACCWVAQSHDIRRFLKPGSNVIAIEADGDGGPTGVLLEGLILSKAGKRLRLASTPDWKSSASAGKGWELAGFDDSAWKPATVAYTVQKGVWGRVPIVPEVQAK